jgi:hypothetical protein
MGPEQAFVDEEVLRVRGCVFSPQRFALAYRGNGQYGAVVVGSVSGDTLTMGKPAAISTREDGGLEIAPLSATQCVIACDKPTVVHWGVNMWGLGWVIVFEQSVAFVGTVSNRSLAFGPEYTTYAQTTFGGESCPAYATGLVSLSPNRVALAYNSTYPWSTGQVAPLDASNNGLWQLANANASGPSYSAALSAKALVLAHPDGTVQACEVADSTMTMGQAVAVPKVGEVVYPAVARLDDSHFLCAGNGFAAVGTVSGSQIALGPFFQFKDRTDHQVALAGVTSSSALAAYPDYTQDGYGFHGIAKILGSADQADPVQGLIPLGVAEEPAGAGESCLVTIQGGVTRQLHKLVPGECYAVTEEGLRRVSWDTPNSWLALAGDRLQVWR